MIIEKNGKEYAIEEQQNNWKISCKFGRVSVEYKIPKDVCSDQNALRKYIETEELF